MKTLILSALAICTSLASDAQNFDLVGPRNLNADIWDIPIARNVFNDANGTLYYYLSEATAPRTNELMRYNEVSDTWDNVTNNSFVIPGGAGVTHGIPQPDGSIITITTSFDWTHYAYTLFPDGTFVPFPSQPDNRSIGGSGIDIAAVQADNGDIYYSHTNIGVGVNKWDGTEWTNLPNVVNSTLGGSSGMGVDENNVPYVIHSNITTSHAAQVESFDGTSWNTLFTSPEIGVPETTLKVFSSTEIYIIYTVLSSDGFGTPSTHVVLYNGTTFENLGSPLPGGQTVIEAADLLKTTSGDLYLANYDGHRGGGIFNYDAAANEWIAIENDIADGGPISGFNPQLHEFNGEIYNSFNAIAGITTVKFTPKAVPLSASGAKNSVADKLIVSSNSTSSNINVDLNTEAESYNLKLSDFSGKRVYENQATPSSGTFKISTSGLANGLYILSVDDNNNNKFVKKIVIEN